MGRGQGEGQRKHGVTFDEAITAFSDPLAMLLPDPDHSLGEARYLVLGSPIIERRLAIVSIGGCLFDAAQHRRRRR